MRKSILFVAIVVVLVAGIFSADYVLAAKDDIPQGQPFAALENRVVALEESQESIDSFFDIVFDLQKPSTTSMINPLQVPLASGYFIKFDGVDGESQDIQHMNWSDLEIFTQGQFQKSSSTPRTSPVLEDIVVVKKLDKASPKLAEAVLKGTVFPKVEIEVTASFTDTGRQTYYKYELTNVQVTSYGISGSGQSDSVPVEQLSLNFEEIKVTYTERDDNGQAKGNVEYTWKVEEGES